MPCGNNSALGNTTTFHIVIFKRRPQFCTRFNSSADVSFIALRLNTSTAFILHTAYNRILLLQNLFHFTKHQSKISLFSLFFRNGSFKMVHSQSKNQKVILTDIPLTMILYTEGCRCRIWPLDGRRCRLNVKGPSFVSLWSRWWQNYVHVHQYLLVSTYLYGGTWVVVLYNG